MTVKTTTIQSLKDSVKNAAFTLQQQNDDVINKTLNDLSCLIVQHTKEIIEKNDVDVKSAKDKNLSAAIIDRLVLNDERIHAMSQSVQDIAALDNPCRKVLEEWVRPNGLKFQKVSVPIGVLGMIYESRPNVTIDAAALSLKSRNAIILRGGSESFYTSQYLHELVLEALNNNNLSVDCVCMAQSTDRTIVDEMLNASDVIDVIIPRGGKGLTQKVMNEAKMPVFAHLDGNCHIYVHHSANPDLALNVIQNAKLRRTGVCGALESLLLDDKLDIPTIQNIINMLLAKGVVVVGDEKTMSLNNSVLKATEDDWSSEYLDKKISIKFVSNVKDAVNHINHYGSHHTDSILCEDHDVADYFLQNVDSAIVMHNTSTQFADGGEFGFGAEIGIGTGKLHARGPVGLKQLCTFKYIVTGDGQTRP